jgi:hypothetical protein
MRSKNEYNVQYDPYSSMFSDEEETAVEEESGEENEQPSVNGAIQFEGYNTVFDIKVSLTPVELIPVGNLKK